MFRVAVVVLKLIDLGALRDIGSTPESKLVRPVDHLIATVVIQSTHRVYSALVGACCGYEGPANMCLGPGSRLNGASARLIQSRCIVNGSLLSLSSYLPVYSVYTVESNKDV